MLDSTQINQLMSFVQGELSFAKGMAQNALCFYYGICREDDYSTEEASIDEEEMFKYILKVSKKDKMQLTEEEVQLILEGEFEYGKSIGIYREEE